MKNRESLTFKQYLITESVISDSVSQLMLDAGYRGNQTSHYPNRENMEDKVNEFESLLKKGGAKRSKSGATEYEYQYKLDGTTVIFNYRFGDKGLAAWWIK